MVCLTPMCQDHPRVCGEKCVYVDPREIRKGSPPRVRGKETISCTIAIFIRITPACAGKRWSADEKLRLSRDHPRVCGEKAIKVRGAREAVGSPPRVRGKECYACVDADGTRITPACAGKRLKRSHSIGHFSCILCLFHSVLHRASVSGGSRAGPCAPPCLPAQNAVPV